MPNDRNISANRWLNGVYSLSNEVPNNGVFDGPYVTYGWVVILFDIPALPGCFSAVTLDVALLVSPGPAAFTAFTLNL